MGHYFLDIQYNIFSIAPLKFSLGKFGSFDFSLIRRNVQIYRKKNIFMCFFGDVY